MMLWFYRGLLFGQILPGLEPLLNSLKEIAQKRRKTIPQVFHFNSLLDFFLAFMVFLTITGLLLSEIFFSTSYNLYGLFLTYCGARLFLDCVLCMEKKFLIPSKSFLFIFIAISIPDYSVKHKFKQKNKNKNADGLFSSFRLQPFNLRFWLQVAINWCICKGTIPIPGVKSIKQAEENLGALGWQLTSDELLQLENGALESPQQMIQNIFQTR